MEKYVREKNISGDIVELCKKKEIKDLIFNDIKQLEKANSLKGFETVSLSFFIFREENIDLFFFLGERYLSSSRTIFNRK